MALRSVDNRQILELVLDRLGGSKELADLLLVTLITKRWSCFCERSRPIQFTKGGLLYSSCRVCRSRIFWGDLWKFIASPVCPHDPPSASTRKKGMWTTWCPECGIRLFFKESEATAGMIGESNVNGPF